MRDGNLEARSAHPAGRGPYFAAMQSGHGTTDRQAEADAADIAFEAATGEFLE
jgi:hypothetical protein